MSKDCPLDTSDNQQILPEVSAPTVEVLRHTRLQIIISWTSHVNEILEIVSFTSDISYVAQNFISLPVYASCPFMQGPPKLQQDKRPQEFLQDEIRCQHFINQDLTFLQLLIIHVPQPHNKTVLPDNTTIEPTSITDQAHNQSQENTDFPPPAYATETLCNRGHANNTRALVQLVEPVLGSLQNNNGKSQRILN